MKTVIEIGKEILALPQFPMSEDESKTFLTCTAIEHQGGGEVPEEVVDSFIFNVLRKRCEFYGIEVSPWVIAFLSTCIDRPGIATLYAAALAAIHHENGRVDFNKLAGMNAFGMGFPNEEGLHKVWEEQKIMNHGSGSDNMLDYSQTSETADAGTDS